MRFSVVIPTLNEAVELPETLRRAWAVPEVAEIIVSDGGSTDETMSLAETGGARIIRGGPGRGAQLRRGAELATGDMVILLHADTWLPPIAGKAVTKALGDAANEVNPLTVGGGFRKTFRDAPWPLQFAASARSWAYFRLTGYLFGDQAIFIRRTQLAVIGGVPALPLMEEFALCCALKKRGRLVLAQATVSTSARRFREKGIFRTWWLMVQLQIAWARGTPPDELRRRYYPMPQRDSKKCLPPDCL